MKLDYPGVMDLRPTPGLERLIHAGRLGRKSGGGYFDYAADAPKRPEG